MYAPKIVRLGVALSFLMAPWSTPVWAATATASATVSATLASRASLTLTRGSSSVTRGSAATVVFDKPDDQDVTGGSGAFMYAPYRSESSVGTGKNWHSASIVANGTSMTLSATVSGTAGSTPLSSIMDVFVGGFFESGATSEIAGTKSADWQPLNTYSKTLSQPFIGTVSFNYRLRIGTISAGTYAGTVTYTLTST